MQPILAVAVLTVLAACLGEARAAGPQGPRVVQASGAVSTHQRQTADALVIAQASSSGQPQGNAPIQGSESDGAPKTFDEKLAGFVTEFYLTGETRSRADLEELYAATVEYFESGRLARERVLRDKQGYFTKWPTRDYKLIRETLKSKWRPGGGKVLDVTFEYDFDVASPARRSRGRGRAELTLDLSLDGGRITREQGVVLQRW